jgi:hypothetical protein
VKATRENELMEAHVVVAIVDGFEYVMNLLKMMMMMIQLNEMFEFKY